MATTTKITATASKYGNSSNASYTNTSNSLYIAKYAESGTTYRSRLTFPSLRSLAAIGDANIVITKVTLHLYYRAEGPATVTAGSSSSSAWGAATDGSGSLLIEKVARWNAIDITDCAVAMLEYPGTWYIHLTGTGNRVRCAGVGSDWVPYINVVWEYTANTLTTDVESVELGKEVHLNISPEEGDASYALTYEFGDESGTIAETSATSIAWTPSLQFASELPSDDSGEVKITMKVYDESGKQLRTEVLYLTVTVPETAVPTISDMGITLVNDLGGYALTGKTYAVIAPVIDINDTYGATIKSVKADITDGINAHTLTWDALTETDAGIFSGAAQNTNIIYNAGEASITLTVTDSRGREVTQTHTINVQIYSNPLITAFSVERYEPIYSADEQVIGYAPSDTGENVWVTLSANCSDIAGLNAIAWHITAKTADGEVVYSGTGDGTQINISNDRSIITAVVSSAANVEYSVAVADTAGYVSFQYDNVTPGRANFALAASKYGASFGCLPKGTEEHPMLESAYPIYAYGGIEGVTNFVKNEVKTGGTWIDGKPIYRQYFEGAGGTASATALLGTIANLDQAIHMAGSVAVPDYDIYIPVNSYRLANSTAIWSGAYVGMTGNVRQASGFGAGGYVRLWVYYTKTTD